MINKLTLESSLKQAKMHTSEPENKATVLYARTFRIFDGCIVYINLLLTKKK